MKIWIDEFSRYQLTRDEKTVVRLGYGEHEISPKEIWDAVGIVDTDYYRQLLESLMKKGILVRNTSTTKAFNAAKRKKTNKKSVPQFVIKKPAQGMEAKVPTRISGDSSDYSRVYVGNVPFDATEQQIREALNHFGAIDSVEIPIDWQSGRGRGYAFIEFERAADAGRLLSTKDRPVIGGRQINVQEAHPRRLSVP